MIGVATLVASVAGPVASALGAYNLARFGVQRAARAKRKAEKTAEVARTVAEAAKVAKAGYQYLKSKDVSKDDILAALNEVAAKLNDKEVQ